VLRILSSRKFSVKEDEATSSWDRRRPRLPAPSLTKKVVYGIRGNGVGSSRRGQAGTPAVPGRASL